MGLPRDECLLTGLLAQIEPDGDARVYSVGQLRLKYKISRTAEAIISANRHLVDYAKKRRWLAYWVCRETLFGKSLPIIDSELIDAISEPSMNERCENYILWLGRYQNNDMSNSVDSSKNEAGKVAICARSNAEAGELIATLADECLIKGTPSGEHGDPSLMVSIRLTRGGFERFEEIKEAGI